MCFTNSVHKKEGFTSLCEGVVRRVRLASVILARRVNRTSVGLVRGNEVDSTRVCGRSAT